MVEFTLEQFRQMTTLPKGIYKCGRCGEIHSFDGKESRQRCRICDSSNRYMQYICQQDELQEK